MYITKLKGGIKMKKIFPLAMGVVLSATVILGSSEYTFAAEKSPKIETNVSDLTEGKLKTVIVNIEDVLSEDTTVFATSSSINLLILSTGARTLIITTARTPIHKITALGTFFITSSYV
jgi:hypothetical protein